MVMSMAVDGDDDKWLMNADNSVSRRSIFRSIKARHTLWELQAFFYDYCSKYPRLPRNSLEKCAALSSTFLRSPMEPSGPVFKTSSIPHVLRMR